jgi:hypothetical protein
MKSYLIKFVYFLAVACFSFGCAKKDSHINDNKSNIDVKIKEIASSPEAFDKWAKKVLTHKFGSTVDYSIEEINIKSIEQFKMAEVVLAVGDRRINYFLLMPASFVEPPLKDKYVLKPIFEMVSDVAILVFAIGETSDHTDIVYNDNNTFTISNRNNTLYFISANY